MVRVKKVFLYLSAILCIGFIALGYFGSRMIIEINNEIYKTVKGKHIAIPSLSDYSLTAESLHFISSDNLRMEALLMKAPVKNPKGTIILLHGIRSCKEHYLSVCKMLVDSGYNAVAVDLRAHGESEGKYCTFGFKEKKDISVLVDTIYAHAEVSRQIGIWGQSLGAAISLQVMAIDRRIKFGIIESTFSDFRTIVYDYASNIVGFRSELLVDYLIWWAEIIGDFDADKIVPAESAKSISQPVLMVHGKMDKRIRFKYGQANYDNLASPNKEFVEFPLGTHVNIWQVGGKEYLKKVCDFIKSNL